MEIFHIETGHWMDSLRGHADWVWDFAFNDRFLVSASCDHTMILWQLANHISSQGPPPPPPFYLHGYSASNSVGNPAGFTPQQHQSKQLQKYSGHQGWVQCVQFNDQKI